MLFYHVSTNIFLAGEFGAMKKYILFKIFLFSKKGLPKKKQIS